MPATSKPKFPVVDPEPNWRRTMANFSVGDLATAGVFSGAGWATGFFGSRLQLRAPNARFLGGVGFMAGFFYAYMSSTQRLMGLQENDSEVRNYGAMSAEDVAKFAKRSHQANIELINTTEKK